MPGPKVKREKKNQGLGKGASVVHKPVSNTITTNIVENLGSLFRLDTCECSIEGVSSQLHGCGDILINEDGNYYTIIDGITFTVLCKSEADDLAYAFPEAVNPGSCHIKQGHIDANTRNGRRVCETRGVLNARDMVCFKSSQVLGYLYAYRSSSELGIWRLAYLRDDDCGLFKGMLDYVQGTLIHHCLMKLINEKWSQIKTATQFITGLAEEDLQPCHGILKGEYCLVPPFSFDSGIEQVIDNKERCSKKTVFDRVKPTCANQYRTPLSEIWGNLMLFGNNLQANYNLQNKIHINEYQFNETYARITATVNIYSVELHHETNPQEIYVLIFCVYEATYNDNITVTGSYGIALLPMNYRVNKYGIYSCYVSANIFICKPFFYSSMCNVTDQKNPLFSCYKSYLYAGFIFDCWPYNAIELIPKRFKMFYYSDVNLRTQIANLKAHISSNSAATPLSQISLSNLLSDTIDAGVTILQRTLTIGQEVATPTRDPLPLQGGKKSHKNKKSHKKRKSQKRRKTQKRSYSIFRSNK